MHTLSRQQARELDRRAVDDFGMTSALLMENAGRGSADVLCQLGIAGPVVIVCGAGNNGGDGFVIARHLDLRGHSARVVLLASPERLQGDAALNYGILAKSSIPILPADALAEQLAGAAWAIDALLGTGATGDPREHYARAITQLNDSRVPLLAVDVPSGLDCDTGQPGTPTLRAAHTCTFVAPKPGLLKPDAAPFVGQLHVVDIGAPRKLVEQILNGAG